MNKTLVSKFKTVGIVFSVSTSSPVTTFGNEKFSSVACQEATDVNPGPNSNMWVDDDDDDDDGDDNDDDDNSMFSKKNKTSPWTVKYNKLLYVSFVSQKFNLETYPAVVCIINALYLIEGGFKSLIKSLSTIWQRYSPCFSYISGFIICNTYVVLLFLRDEYFIINAQ